MSTPDRRPSRPARRPLLAAVALLGVLGLASCTHQRQVPDQYGDTTRDNFTEGCIEALTQEGEVADGLPAEDLGDSPPLSREAARNQCTCTYEEISGPDGIPFDRFKAITEAQEDDPGPLPAEILEMVEDCERRELDAS